MRQKDALGKYGEDVAIRFLQQQGFMIIDRNWRCDLGEIDVIARDGAALVFCEVKTRSSLSHGHPIEAVSARKVRRLRRLALRWLLAHGVHAPILRFDVVGVIQSQTGTPQITHVAGAE
jgi:putative endonuclease